MTLQGLADWLLPRDDKFFLLLEQQGEILGEVVLLLSAFVESYAKRQPSLDGIHRIEHRGDELVHAMTIALSENFVTPIAREDLHSLATSLDNVIDNLYRGTQAFVAYEVHDLSPAMRELLQLCIEGATMLKEAIPYMRHRQLQKLGPVHLQLVELEKRSDAVHRAELATLFQDPAIDAKDLLRQKAVLDALEAALDSCQDAADVLENVAIKHA